MATIKNNTQALEKSGAFLFLFFVNFRVTFLQAGVKEDSRADGNRPGGENKGEHHGKCSKRNYDRR